MDKKAFIAVGLSLLIWVAWQKFYLEPIQNQAALENQRYQEALKKQTSEEKAASPAVSEGGRAASAEAGNITPSKNPVPVKLSEVNLFNSSSSLSLSNGPWAVSNWQLKTFSLTLEKLDEKVTLNEATGFGTQVRARFSDPALSSVSVQPWASIEKDGDRKATSKIKNAELEGTRTIFLDDDGYGGRVEYKFSFAKEPPKFVFLDLLGSPKRANDQEGSIFGQAPDKVHVTFRDLNGRHSHMGAGFTENVETAAGVKWLGLDTKYFVLAIVPIVEGNNDIGAQVVNEIASVPGVRGSLVFPTQGKRDVTVAAKLYFGPKHMESLTKVDPVLSDAIDFGWTSALAIPLLQALKWLHSFLKNYGLAIIALTFIIKMLLFPLMYKSMKSMAKMSKLQPQLTAIREKFKDDKEKLNVEMMNFMKANGYNPIGGCLPILLQMPIFFALYRVLFNSMELYQAPFFGWIHDLSSPDPFFVTPILLTVLMYFQQKLSPTTAMDPAQQKMLQIMPVLFGAFMLMLPSGLTIYMVVNSVVSIAQQWFLNKKLGITPGVNTPVTAT